MKIARIRKSQGMTQSELADLCQTSQQQIAKIEGDVVDPRLSTLRRIAAALDCQLTELFYTADEFLTDVKQVIEEEQLELGSVSLWELNDICQRKAGIPSYEPLWERIEIKKDSIYLKEKKK